MSTFATPTIPPEPLESHPKWCIGVGAVLASLGVAAIAFPWFATLAANILFGVLLVAAAASQLVLGIRMRPHGDWALHIGTGVLSAIAGVLLIAMPVPGVVTLTLLLCAALALGGVLRIAAGVQRRDVAGWPWRVASGVLSLILATLILVGFPQSAFWILGLVLGVDLLFQGVGLIAWAGAYRRWRRDIDREDRSKRTDRVGQASWESFPASDPPGFGR